MDRCNICGDKSPLSCLCFYLMHKYAARNRGERIEIIYKTYYYWYNKKHNKTSKDFFEARLLSIRMNCEDV